MWILRRLRVFFRWKLVKGWRSFVVVVGRLRVKSLRSLNRSSRRWFWSWRNLRKRGRREGRFWRRKSRGGSRRKLIENLERRKRRGG